MNEACQAAACALFWGKALGWWVVACSYYLSGRSGRTLHAWVRACLERGLTCPQYASKYFLFAGLFE